MSIEFRDLKRQYNTIKDAIDSQIATVIGSSHFILFPERNMWRFGSSYAVFASLSFLFLGLVDMSFRYAR